MQYAPRVLHFSAFHFNKNMAGIAGNAIYGGLTSACMPSDNCLFFDLPHIYEYNGLN